MDVMEYITDFVSDLADVSNALCCYGLSGINAGEYYIIGYGAFWLVNWPFQKSAWPLKSTGGSITERRFQNSGWTEMWPESDRLEKLIVT